MRSRRKCHENAPEEDEQNGEQIELDVVPLHGQQNTAIPDLVEEKNSSDDEGKEEEQGSDGTSSSSEESDEEDVSFITYDGESVTISENEETLPPGWGPKKYSTEYHPLALMVSVGLAVCL